MTVAGSGVDGHSGDGGLATAADIDHPRGIAFLRDGSFLFAEPFANAVRRVSPDGTISTIGGTGEIGSSGDGGPATAAHLFLVHGVAELTDGSFILADAGTSRIRRVRAGIITTVAGTGARGFSGDGGPAVAARIANPRGVAALPDGGFLILDTDNHRIRRVWPDGTITTVAGTGAPGFSGDSGPASRAQLQRPFGVAPTADGGFSSPMPTTSASGACGRTGRSRRSPEPASPASRATTARQRWLRFERRTTWRLFRTAAS